MIPVKEKNVKKLIYVSVGHLVQLETAVKLVQRTSLHRIPEAVRRADGGSREVLRELEENKRKNNEIQKVD